MGRNSLASEPQTNVLDNAPAEAPRVIAVTSGKGGVGKTMLAANMAVGLSQSGRKVLLVDADLALANLDLVLGVRARRTVRDVLSNRAQIADAIVQGPAGVSLLPACPGDESFSKLDTSTQLALLSALDSLEASYDTVIVDTGAGIGSNATTFSAAAQQILVVVTPDPPSMADAYAMIKTLALRGIKRINLVVNVAGSALEADGVVEQLLGLVERFLDTAVVPVGFVPRDDAVVQSVRGCRPLAEAYPNSAAGQAIASLSHRLLTESCDVTGRGPLLFWKRVMGLTKSEEMSNATSR